MSDDALELEQLSARIEQMDAVIQETVKENEACQGLTAIPGIGPVTATALVASIGNGAGFRREVARHQQAGKLVLRRLFVQGARVVILYRSKQAPGLSNWLSQLMARPERAVVALANMLLRMASGFCAKTRHIGFRRWPQPPESSTESKHFLPGLLAHYRDGTTVERGLSKRDIGKVFQGDAN